MSWNWSSQVGLRPERRGRCFAGADSNPGFPATTETGRDSSSSTPFARSTRPRRSSPWGVGRGWAGLQRRMPWSVLCLSSRTGWTQGTEGAAGSSCERWRGVWCYLRSLRDSTGLLSHDCPSLASTTCGTASETASGKRLARQPTTACCPWWRGRTRRSTLRRCCSGCYCLLGGLATEGRRLRDCYADIGTSMPYAASPGCWSTTGSAGAVIHGRRGGGGNKVKTRWDPVEGFGNGA